MLHLVLCLHACMHACKSNDTTTRLLSEPGSELLVVISLQVFHRFPTAHLLLCAPQNYRCLATRQRAASICGVTVLQTAGCMSWCDRYTSQAFFLHSADLLVSALAAAGLDPTNMLRLNDPRRPPPQARIFVSLIVYLGELCRDNARAARGLMLHIADHVQPGPGLGVVPQISRLLFAQRSSHFCAVQTCRRRATLCRSARWMSSCTPSRCLTLSTWRGSGLLFAVAAPRVRPASHGIGRSHTHASEVAAVSASTATAHCSCPLHCLLAHQAVRLTCRAAARGSICGNTYQLHACPYR